jgi:glucose/arabinose dehydrogenase
MITALAAAATIAAIPFPTNIDFDPAGGMWVSSGSGSARSSDGVWYVPKGRHQARHVIRGVHTALGLRWHGGELYVSHVVTPSQGRVSAYKGFDGKRFKRRRTVLPSLRIGRHTVDSIINDGGRLLVGVGSVEDHTGPSGRVVSFGPDGKGTKVVATGLRNPYGMAFIPGTRRLLMTDNGRDDLGPSGPPDELNLADLDAPSVPNFGFPTCPATCPGPVAELPPHSSSDGLAVKAAPDGSTIAYVAAFGSSFAANYTGHDLRKVVLRPNSAGGYDATVSVVATFGQSDPLGAAIGPDGALYVTLLISGKVLRYDV